MRGHRRRATAVVTTALLAIGAVAIEVRAAVPACAAESSGGEWREYSHDLENTRHQPEELVIGPAEAAALEPAWTFTVAASGGSGVFHHDPIVADGCVYLASNTGFVYALNADSGAIVWTTRLADGVSSSPTVKNGRVYLHASRRNAPYLVVLDQGDGSVIRQVTLDDVMQGTELISSPKVFGGLVFSGISGAGAEAGTTFTGNPQSRLHFRGIYAITVEATGEVTKGYTIPDADFAAGYSGGGIWSTPAVDTTTGYAYVGSGNPFSPREHHHTNAILKIGVDATRSDYGEIVAVYHGTNDQYVDGVTYKPTCDAYVDVFTCETSDFDFGASPQLFSVGGVPVVGAHQKSGVYHVATRADMTPVWKATVGGPFGWFGGEGTASFDGTSIVVPGNVPGLLSRLDKESGAARWVAPIADGIHFTSVTTANGVAYVIDTRGVLDVWDTATGQQIAARPLGVETGSPTESGFSTGYSVSVARNTVFAPYGGSVVAYRAPQAPS